MKSVCKDKARMEENKINCDLFFLPMEYHFYVIPIVGVQSNNLRHLPCGRYEMDTGNQQFRSTAISFLAVDSMPQLLFLLAQVRLNFAFIVVAGMVKNINQFSFVFLCVFIVQGI